MPLAPTDVPPHISTEFHSPFDLLQQGITVPELYDWHAQKNPDYPVFTYYDDEKAVFITYATANLAIDRVARYVASRLGLYNADMPRHTVSVFANADTITYFCTKMGILRTGCTVFPISTRNGPAAIADMLQKTGASHLMLSQDIPIRETAQDALSRLPAGQVTTCDMPTFEDLFPSGQGLSDKAFQANVELPKTFGLNSCAIIMHSSGSSDFPKPFRCTHKGLIAWGRLSFEVDPSYKSVFGCHGVPMFHAMGTYVCCAAPINGYVAAVFKPMSPPMFPTPDAVWQNTVATKCDYIFTVPSNIEEWSRDPEKVAIMRQMGGFLFGGAPLNVATGDNLASHGVSLFPAYGLTEVGTVSQGMGPHPGMDWAYWTPVRNKQFRFVPRGDNKYEVVVLSDPELPLPVINTEIDGREAYATNDLVEPHPTKPNYWKVFGRADDQIVLSNGEKTNPLPLEKIVNQDPHIENSMLFGSGKFQNGILVEPKEAFAIEPSDSSKVEEFRNAIWPTIERANAYAPQHSRIFKEMILVTSPSKPFQLSIKGLPRRKVMLAEYHVEIETLYKHVEDSAQSDLRAPTSWDEASTLAFVRAIVHETLRRPIGDEDDIFRHGCDSLQATWIRNTILRALRETEPEAVKRLQINFVFQAPTISGLAHTVTKANDIQDGKIHSHTPQELWKYVSKYSAKSPERSTSLVDRPASKDIILITGTTGGFGCDTLEHLLRDEAVERVYAFNRKGCHALERQRAQFRTRGLDESLLDGPKFRMVEALLHEPGFGLERTLLDEIRQSVTHIMHNGEAPSLTLTSCAAWKVDFKLFVQSFEMDIQGARNLVDLAISSPNRQAPTVVFVSSIGVFASYSGTIPVLEAPVEDPVSPFGVGYGESKWVTEHVLQNAVKQSGLHAVVVRLGQVCGDRLGHWNEKEWFPAIVKSAQFLRCLPDVEGNVTWVPGYETAKAFAEMRNSSEPFLHLVHPKPVPWRTIITPIAEELGVPLVTYDEWLSALRKSTHGLAGSADEVGLMKANPALRLVDFFGGLKTLPEREPMGTVYLSTEKAIQVSPTLDNLPALGALQAKQWLAAWRRSGFLASSAP
ncbi:acetyl-CoA synthetase-like protein [Trametes sanguinea]|nr:acetyl-CoA synthetase-like protein [Trametes sanguinea]